MKLYGITGTGSGKLGSSVFSITAGTQVVRQYQPVVTNPSTSAQVNVRARLKLISQLSAVMGDVIAIPRQGNATSRNLFVKDNYGKTFAANGQAAVDLAAISLTRGGMQIPAVIAERIEGTSISVALASKADQIVNRVVYVMFYRNAAGELQLVDSAVVEDAGDNGLFPYELPWIEKDVVVYAYGIYDRNAKATAKFGTYSVTTGTQVASLVANRIIKENDYLLTKTKGIFLVGETSIEVTSCKVDNTTINPTGSTTVPFIVFGNISVVATDVEDKYLSVSVNGNRLDPSPFNGDGQANVFLSGLVGGEVIRIQIGVMQGTQFVPQFTYGGTAVIGQQSTAISSVTANGVAISASGNTQIAQASNIEFWINGTGCVNKYFRVSVNGVAREPVLFVDNQNQQYSNDTLTNLNVGDVVTFQVGRVVNGTFVEDVAYGGSAVVAEVPATFTAVSVNGTNVASSGSTNVNVSDPNNIIVDTQNAIGKYLGILDGNNQVLSVHAISNNRTSLLQQYAEGDTIKFAIGTGSSTSSFVAQTNFGGTVVFVNTPTGLSNVVLNGTSLDTILYQQAVDGTIAGNVDSESVNKTLILVHNDSAAPVVGAEVNVYAKHYAIGSTSFNVNYTGLDKGVSYYVCLGTLVSGTTYQITDVHQYKFVTEDEW